jgi:hypothetical protein
MKGRAKVLRASLASAISLLAPLLLGGHQARATPSADTGAPDNAVCACFQLAMATKPAMDIPIVYSAPYYSNLKILPYAPTGKATFSQQTADGSAPGAPTSLFETISSINRTIVYDHAKPGKMAAASAGWSNAGGTSVYVGTSANLALEGGSSGGSTPSYIPGLTGTISGNSKPAVLDAAYIPNTPYVSAESFAANSKLSKTVRPSGPIYASSIIGSGVTNTPQPGTRSLVDFGTIELNSSLSLELEIQNLATEAGSASDLTVEGYTITGADPGSFSVDSDVAGTVIHAGGTLLVPLTVVGTGPGDLTSNLTIFTNAGSSAVGAGEAFNYLLDPMVVVGLSDALAPEPASIAVIGVGLAALAALRRRRAQ